jgi:hypothetical protein
MEYLVKDEKLILIYEPGKGAWTYHIQIPNTKHIIGKWGSLKASGFVDDYKIESINLFTISGQDKLISINDKIKKAINKTGGDTVIVTLYLLNSGYQISEGEITDTFKESDVYEAFMKLSEMERIEILAKITSIKSEDQLEKILLAYIDRLGNE